MGSMDWILVGTSESRAELGWDGMGDYGMDGGKGVIRPTLDLLQPALELPYYLPENLLFRPNPTTLPPIEYKINRMAPRLTSFTHSIIIWFRSGLL